MNKTNSMLKEHYDLYIERCKSELKDLFETIRGAYEDAYGTTFEVPEIDHEKWNIDNVLPENVRHTVDY